MTTMSNNSPTPRPVGAKGRIYYGSHKVVGARPMPPTCQVLCVVTNTQLNFLATLKVHFVGSRNWCIWTCGEHGVMVAVCNEGQAGTSYFQRTKLI
jgi:hypothetical protein